MYLEKLVKAEIEVVTECNFVDYSLTFCGTFILTCKNNENGHIKLSNIKLSNIKLFDMRVTLLALERDSHLKRLPGCSLENLNENPKRDPSGCGKTLFHPEEISLK